MQIGIEKKKKRENEKKRRSIDKKRFQKAKERAWTANPEHFVTFLKP